MHARLARYLAKTMPLRIVELPVPIPPFTEAIQWPAVHNTDPASIWPRGIVINEAGRITKGST
jgi:LysR family transcriptional regulator, nod-box dependent transcriptional activator